MPKKPSNVFVNENCVRLITEYCNNADISKAAFSRKFDKHDRWVSELARGRSMPSPEEAARICAMLQVAPEDILQLESSTEEGTEKRRADIELVRSLLEQEREKSAKKGPTREGEALSSAKQELWDAIDDLTDEQCGKLLGIILEAKKAILK